MFHVKLMDLHHPLWVVTGSPFHSQRKAQIPATETFTSQGNMIQGANLECAERNSRLFRTDPSFQVIPQTKTENICNLQVKFLPLRNTFFTQFSSLAPFLHQDFTVEQKVFQGIQKYPYSSSQAEETVAPVPHTFQRMALLETEMHSSRRKHITV